MVQSKIQNPILRGFNPDPYILKGGEMYYIAVSSFEWLPGIRIYGSEDLVNWEHVTDILTDQVDLRGNPQNCSIWAPQLSYHDGLYYCIYTDVKNTTRPFKDCHNYLITSKSITGPWSSPIYLNSSGFDPSLFHDKDGRKWLLNEIWDYRMTTGNKSAGIVLQEYDPTTQQLVGEVYKIFDGTPLAKTEAPHIYYHQGFYYLITAEGGTGSGHSVTICRAKEITGPYELDPEYPILTASDKPESPLQCSGHGSIVEGINGKWYMAYLTTRPLLGKAAILGRETAIQEVIWTEDGWLRLANGSTAPEEYTMIETKSVVQQEIDTDFRDDFDGPLAKEWNARRIMPEKSWCDLTTRPGYLRMISGESPQSTFEQHLLAIRQKDFRFQAETMMEFDPKTFNQMAGLFLFLSEQNYIYCYVTYDESKGSVLRLMQCKQGENVLLPDIIELTDHTTYLKVVVEETKGQFYWKSSEQSEWQEIGETFNLLFLAGGFTGNFVGIGVQDLDKQFGCYADFNYFEYKSDSSSI
ncbi:glycoside hydrolase family 43 protein [Amphibacillus sp. MSJ-3]|uniref:glycoside hydrolase family 43 protein n=1 Tax=Amphibacillus sp. MSJ-3 TaxID=2841505 RepID=UPI001C0F3A4E|nr:glycoside hydrolase family 43 protein [Amphibacillus sp. MSJ-3]MBU5595084.1 glycoside hydrolase family 43 protein [Amphibacillus sp. MSJ-3]